MRLPLSVYVCAGDGEDFRIVKLAPDRDQILFYYPGDGSWWRASS